MSTLRAPKPRQQQTAKPWHKRKRWWALIVLLLLLAIGALGEDPQSSSRPADTERQTPQAEAAPTAEPTPDPAEQIVAAQREVEQDNYSEALASVAALGDDDETR